MEMFIYVYAHILMMTKIISLSDKAYSRMKSIKADSESFSDVVIRLTEKKTKMPISAFFGKWPGGAEELNKIERILKEDRKRFKTRDVHELLS
ncbi:antitoxin VapB family protein [Candidatus Woesearchaeota archaeon]|nr:antitoxin VapB family protein [Candidatus Woesearchaeota archaeon]